MLKNAKEMRKNYLKTVKRTAEDIIETIYTIEKENLWEAEMGEERTLDLVYLTYGDNNLPCDLSDVYQYLNSRIDERISSTKSVISALDEIFDIVCSGDEFWLFLLGYGEDEIE